MDTNEELELLRQSVKILKARLIELVENKETFNVSKSQVSVQNQVTSATSKVHKHSDMAHNPYSRLEALKKMGIVKNYEEIKTKTVAIVGVGGIGIVAADMLTRCGIGKLILFDYDTVELANMNRQFYRPEHVGMSKAQVAKNELGKINSEVTIECFDYDIASVSNYQHFVDRLTIGALVANTPVDMVLCCVDNYTARMSVNQVCTEHSLTWMESGVSDDAISGHIQLMLPGRTACYACVPPYLVASETDEKTLKREDACTASLPTTMGIIAAMLVQNTIKHLLQFGTVSYHTGYHALFDFFDIRIVYPNPECTLGACAMQQQAHYGWQPTFEPIGSIETEEPVVHQDNEWNIELVPETYGEEAFQGDAYANYNTEYPVDDSQPVEEYEENHNEETLDSLREELHSAQQEQEPTGEDTALL